MSKSSFLFGGALVTNVTGAFLSMCNYCPRHNSDYNTDQQTLPAASTYCNVISFPLCRQFLLQFRQLAARVLSLQFNFLLQLIKSLTQHSDSSVITLPAGYDVTHGGIIQQISAFNTLHISGFCCRDSRQAADPEQTQARHHAGGQSLF